MRSLIAHHHQIAPSLHLHQITPSLDVSPTSLIFPTHILIARRTLPGMHYFIPIQQEALLFFFVSHTIDRSHSVDSPEGKNHFQTNKMLQWRGKDCRLAISSFFFFHLQKIKKKG